MVRHMLSMCKVLDVIPSRHQNTYSTSRWISLMSNSEQTAALVDAPLPPASALCSARAARAAQGLHLRLALSTGQHFQLSHGF